MHQRSMKLYAKWYLVRLTVAIALIVCMLGICFTFTLQMIDSEAELVGISVFLYVSKARASIEILIYTSNLRI